MFSCFTEFSFISLFLGQFSLVHFSPIWFACVDLVQFGVVQFRLIWLSFDQFGLVALSPVWFDLFSLLQLSLFHSVCFSQVCFDF